MQYYYRGDVKKLIPNGWKFQKLYGMNYKTYHKDKIWMFVVSKMCLEIDNVKSRYQELLIKFILDNINKPFDFWEKPELDGIFKGSLTPEWVLQNGKIVSYEKSIANSVDHMIRRSKGIPSEYVEDGFNIEYSFVEIIKNLTEIGEVILPGE